MGIIMIKFLQMKEFSSSRIFLEQTNHNIFKTIFKFVVTSDKYYENARVMSSPSISESLI